MQIEKNVDLKDYCTIGFGGTAKYLIKAQTEKDIEEAVALATKEELPVHILGDGSNTVFTDTGFDGVVLKIENKGLEINEDGLVTAAAGENWDTLVKKTVDLGYSGVEALSLIPGTVGAAPVQNIGAYGQELSDTFLSLRAYDIKNHKFVDLDKSSCQFDYRTSRLKQNPNELIVTEVKLQLSKNQMKPPFYTTLQHYFDENNITDFNPSNVRDGVVAWRKNYLPDVSKVKTAGSFFTNPIITKSQLDKIINENPQINNWKNKWYWETKDGKYKVAAGRLADQLGLKDYQDQETGISTWKNSALILINRSARSYQDLANFRKNYLSKIRQSYGISFEQEPIEI